MEREISVTLELQRPLDGSLRSDPRFRLFGRVSGSRLAATVTESRAERVLRWLARHWETLAVERLVRFDVPLNADQWGGTGATELGVLHPYTCFDAATPGSPLALEWVPDDEPVCRAGSRYVVHDRLGAIVRRSGDRVGQVEVGGRLSERWHEWAPADECDRIAAWCVDGDRWLGLWVAADDGPGPEVAARDRSTFDGGTHPVLLGPDVVDRVRRTSAAVAPVFPREAWPARFAELVRRHIDPRPG